MVDSSVIVTTIDIPYSLSLWGMFLSCKLLYCVNLSTVCVHVCSTSSVVSNFLWPMDCSPPGSSVHGILWARILEWVAMLSSKGSSQPRDWTQSSCVASIAGTFFTTEPPGKPCLSSNICFSAVFVQSLSRVRLFVTPMDCSMPSFPVLHYLSEFSQTCPLSRWCHPTISSSVISSSCLQNFPVSGSFSMSQLSASGDQSIGALVSASVLPMNIQYWSPLGWTGSISL